MKKFSDEKRRTSRMSSIVFFLVLTTLTFAGHVHSKRIYTPKPLVAVGSNVTIYSDTNVTLGLWQLNNDVLVLVYPGGHAITNAYKDRVIYNSAMSALTIRSATLNYSGVYTLNSINDFIASLTISVEEPITNATLSAQKTHLIEYNDTAVLMCSVSTGSPLTYIWLDGNSTIVEGGNAQLSNKNMTLTIPMVTRHNQGPYRCNVSNDIGYDVSPPLQLNISYGPDNIIMTVMPVGSIFKTGSNISLSCSAESSPSAMIQWMFNDVYLNQFGPQLHLENTNESYSGIYKCIFHNAVTLRYSSASSMIQIMDPIKAVIVKPMSALAILHEPFSLTCDVTGPVDSILWWKNGQIISADNTKIFDTTNKTLTLTPAQLSDNGNFMCHAFNFVSDMTSSPYTVQINYGPDMLTITGSNVVKAGGNVTLSCQGESVPPSHYQWYFKGSLVSNMSEYITPPLSMDMSGNYICMAFNILINKNSTASIMLKVVDPIVNVQIEAQANTAIEGGPYELTCNTTGTVDHIYWMKNGQPLHADNRTIFTMHNKTVMFNPVERSDTGHYQCMAINAFENMTSIPYWLLVSYGPDMPTIVGPKAVLRGNTATLNCSADSVPSSVFSWYANGSLVSNMSEYITPPLYKDMNWMFMCMAFNNITGKSSSASIMLTVIDPIENVQVEAQMKPCIEGGLFELICNTTGPVDFIHWMKNDAPIHADNRVVFSMDNKTIMFMPVDRSDAGSYQCMAMNAVQSVVSSYYTLLVNYGPDVPIIMGHHVAKVGGFVTLSCHAASIPTSRYEWHFNGSVVSNMSEYTTPPLNKNTSWIYTCMAFNDITGKSSNASIMLTVIDPIENVQIGAQMNPCIEGGSYELTCNATGPVDFIHWMKNGEAIQADNRTVFSMDNKMITFMPVDRSDAGSYQCMAMNAAENVTSAPYYLLVNFGPATPIISGPTYGETGSHIIFSCNALSVPPSSFSWWFNGSMISNTSVLNVGPLSLNMSGKYTCMAYNRVTGKNSTNSTMLTIIETIKSVKISNNTMPINNTNFTLICNVIGPYDTIYWMKNGMHLSRNASSTNSSMYGIKGNMLHFTPVTVENNGTYHCVAINKATHHKSPEYILRVNYGPLNIYIAGPTTKKAATSGSLNVSLTCSADSHPDCIFRWFLNKKSVPVGNGAVLTFLAGKKNEGNYICEATNPVTNLTKTQTKTYSVAGHASATLLVSKGGLLFVGLCALSAHLLFL